MVIWRMEDDGWGAVDCQYLNKVDRFEYEFILV